MSRVLVVDSSGPTTTGLAAALAEAGVETWSTSNPLIALELVRQHAQLHCVVLECAPSAIPLCRRLRQVRSDLEIIGLRALSQDKRPDGCALECERLRAPAVETLAPLLQALLLEDDALGVTG